LPTRGLRMVTDAASLCSAYVRRMKHSTKMMWGCVVILALAVIVSITVANAGFLLFALPCMLMMGAMMWMMMGGMRGGSRGGDQK
jgi:hypothetical protein